MGQNGSSSGGVGRFLFRQQMLDARGDGDGALGGGGCGSVDNLVLKVGARAEYTAAQWRDSPPFSRWRFFRQYRQESWSVVSSLSCNRALSLKEGQIVIIP